MRLEVVGAVEVGGAVDVGGAGALHELDVGLFADVLGAFEHHVLEEMSEAGAAGALVERPDVIPEIDRDQRQAMVFMRDDEKAVGQSVLFVLQLRNLERLGGRGLSQGRRGGDDDRDSGDCGS